MVGAYAGLLIAFIDILDSAMKAHPAGWRAWALLVGSVVCAWGRRYATTMVAGWVSRER